jgi:hypothetical protein
MMMTAIGLGSMLAVTGLALLMRRARTRRPHEVGMPIVERQAVRGILMKSVVRIAPR